MTRTMHAVVDLMILFACVHIVSSLKLVEQDAVFADPRDVIRDPEKVVLSTNSSQYYNQPLTGFIPSCNTLQENHGNQANRRNLFSSCVQSSSPTARGSSCLPTRGLRRVR